MFQKSSNQNIDRIQMNVDENLLVFSPKQGINRSRSSNVLLHFNYIINNEKDNKSYCDTEEASFICNTNPKKVQFLSWDDQYLLKQKITNQQKYSRENLYLIFSCGDYLQQQLEIALNDVSRQSSTLSDSNRSQKFTQHFIAAQNARMGMGTSAQQNNGNIIKNQMRKKCQGAEPQTSAYSNKSQKVLDHEKQSLSNSDNKCSLLDESEFVMSNSLQKKSSSTVYSARNQGANLEYNSLTQSDQDQIVSQQSDETVRICYELSQDSTTTFLDFFDALCSEEETTNFIQNCKKPEIDLKKFPEDYNNLIHAVLTNKKKSHSNFDNLGSNSETEYISSMEDDKFVLYFTIRLLRACLDKKGQINVQVITAISKCISQKNHKAFMNSCNQVIFDSIHIDLANYYMEQTHYIEASLCIIRYKRDWNIEFIKNLISKLESKQQIQHSNQHQCQYSQISRLLRNEFKLPQDNLLFIQNIATNGTKIHSQRSPDFSSRNRMQKQTRNQIPFITQTPRTSGFHKKDFKIGYTLQTKGDQELVQIACTYVSQANQTIKNTNNINPVNSDSMIQSDRGTQNLLTEIFVTIREINIEKYDKIQIRQLKKAIIFLNNNRHENLLDYWGFFCHSKKLFLIHEPVIQPLKLSLPLQCSTKDQMAQKVSAIQFPKEQLYNFVSQMINLQKYLLENHDLKALHIKPDNILLSQNGQLKVYHLVVPSSSEPSKNIEQMTRNMTETRVKQLATDDLLDLGQFIYYLCTKERLLPEVKQYIVAWYSQYPNQKATYKKPNLQSISNYTHSIDKFIQLPTEIQQLILLFIDERYYNMFHNWKSVQFEVNRLIGSQKNSV